MGENLSRRQFLTRVGGVAAWGSASLMGLKSSISGRDCPLGLTREDLVHLFEGPWRGLRAVIEKKVIDFHTHTRKKPGPGATLTMEQVDDEIRRGLRSPAQWPPGFVPSVEELIASMDTHGIARACVGTAKAAKEQYEAEVKVVSKYPDRLIILCGPDDLRFESPKEAAAQVRRKLEAGARGIGESLATDSIDKVRPTMEVAAEFGVPVLWGVRGGAYAQREPEQLAKFVSAFPSVNFVMADAGGKGFIHGGGWKAVIMGATYKNLYLEIGGGPVELIEAAVKNMGAEKVVFGTDFSRPDPHPDLRLGHRDGYTHWRNLNAVALANISEAQRDLILYQNAARLLKLQAPESPGFALVAKS